MKIYQVEGPDGKVYEVQGPDDATPEQVVSYAESQFSMKGGPQKEATMMDEVDGALGSFMNTATFGLGDKIGGAGRVAGEYVKSLIDGGNPDLEKAYNLPRQKRTEFAGRNPKTNIATSIAGAVANPVGMGLGRWAVQAPGMAAKIGRGAQAGAAIGGLQAAGEAQGSLADRAGAGLEGAAYGGTIGAILPPVIGMVGGSAKALLDQTIGRLPHRQPTVALRKVAEALQRDGLAPAQAQAKIQQMGPQAALMDAGENARALAATAYLTPGKGKETISKYLTGRQEGTRTPGGVLEGGQANRIIKGIDELIPEQYHAKKSEVEAARKALGGAYESAKGGGDLVDTSKVLKSLDAEIEVSKGSIKAGLQKVRKLLLDEKGRPEIEVGTLHQAKMAIDDFMSGEAKSSIGRVAKGRILDYQKQLVDAIEGAGESGAAYRAGRLGTAGQWRLDESLDAGVKFMRNTGDLGHPKALKAALDGMSEAERHHFRIGAAQAIKDKLSNMVVRADATKKVLDIPALEQKIKMAFGDERLFQRYVQGLEGEKEMFKTYAKVLGNSKTAEMQAALQDAGVDPGAILQGAVDAKTGGLTSLIRGIGNMASGAKQRVFMPAPISAELSKILTGRGTGGLNKAVGRLNLGKKAEQKLIEALIQGEGSLIGSEVGQIAGRR